MRASARPSAFIAVMTAGVLLFQFGACSFSTKPQKIPVTSNPMGAKIIADGKERGTAPLTLSLRRQEGHRIRIELPGYNPVEILLASKPSAANPVVIYMLDIFVIIPLCIFAGLSLGWAVAGTENIDHKKEGPIVAGAVAGAVGGLALAIGVTHKAHEPRLDPSVVNVTLEKAGEQARTNVIILDRDRLKDIRWIRISCAEGGEAGVVAVN